MSRTDEPDDLFSVGGASGASPPGSVPDVVRNFDPARLTQARQLAGLSKRELADMIKVSAAGIGQYESGTRPGPAILLALAEALGYPVPFFRLGRPYARLDPSAAHFRHLRSTRSYQRAKAVSFTEQVWELIFALERRVELPYVDLPGFAGGELTPGTVLPREPVLAAQALRKHWGLGADPIPHLVRTLEVHGIVVVHAPADGDFVTVDAFSTSRLPRPFVVIGRDRTLDVFRHRFTTAHELGHLVLHADALPGDSAHEREADAFAAEFLTPRASIQPLLPRRVNFAALAELQRSWGVSMQSLVYRCRELGIFTDATTTRAYQRLNGLGMDLESVDGFPGEQPSLLRSAFELACDHGLSMANLADELRWPVDRIRSLLGTSRDRPVLRLVTGENIDDGTRRSRRRDHIRAVRSDDERISDVGY